MKVCIANPEGVCVGSYAVEILERAFSAEQKLAFKRNLINYTESCEKTSTAVSLKMADAVIGWSVYEIESLTVRAGSFVLQDMNLRLAEGEFHVILGPSGSGKSTLLNGILGILKPEQGLLRLYGVDITHLPIEQRGLGYVPQQLGLFPHLTVRENISYSARARGLSHADFQPVLDKLIDVTRIQTLLDRYPDTLSGGERQRAGLVRAMASQPAMLLLDEPFTALDQSLRLELWRLLLELRRQRRLTVLMITHDLDEAYFMADSLTLLAEGNVLQQGGKDELFTRPSSLEAARFLGVENLLPSRVLNVADGYATLQIGSTQLFATVASVITGVMWICIRAEEVMVETDTITASHTRNTLVARVVSVRSTHCLLHLELDVGFPLMASLSSSTHEKQKYHTGMAVTVCIPQDALHLIASK